MSCIKTGAQVYLKQHHRYVICDIHQFSNGMWILRANPKWDEKPLRSELHATIENVTQEWPGVIDIYVIEYIDYTYHGYDGLEIANGE